MKDRCCNTVYTNRGFSSHQCERKAVEIVDGKGYCYQHSPAEIKKRYNKKMEEYELAHLDRKMKLLLIEAGECVYSLYQGIDVVLPEELRIICGKIKDAKREFEKAKKGERHET